jgi:PhnB protein
MHDGICHTTLTFGPKVLARGDAPDEHYERPRGFEILLGIDDRQEAERLCHALAQNGTVKMPMQKTFWATLIDQLGVPWEISCAQ